MQSFTTLSSELSGAELQPEALLTSWRSTCSWGHDKQIQVKVETQKTHKVQKVLFKSHFKMSVLATASFCGYQPRFRELHKPTNWSAHLSCAGQLVHSYLATSPELRRLHRNLAAQAVATYNKLTNFVAKTQSRAAFCSEFLIKWCHNLKNLYTDAFESNFRLCNTSPARIKVCYCYRVVRKIMLTIHFYLHANPFSFRVCWFL